MSMTMRVSLPTYDALTDGTVDHYSVYADTDNVLIKEKSRGTIVTADGAVGTINHNLGYVPFYLVYSQISPTRYRINNAYDIVGSGWRAYSGTANLFIDNMFGTAGTVSRYYIFYDNVGASV